MGHPVVQTNKFSSNILKAEPSEAEKTSEVGIYKRKQESKKTRLKPRKRSRKKEKKRKKTRSRPRKRPRKKEKHFLSFFLLSCFLL